MIANYWDPVVTRRHPGPYVGITTSLSNTEYPKTDSYDDNNNNRTRAHGYYARVYNNVNTHI